MLNNQAVFIFVTLVHIVTCCQWYTLSLSMILLLLFSYDKNAVGLTCKMVTSDTLTFVDTHPTLFPCSWSFIEELFDYPSKITVYHSRGRSRTWKESGRGGEGRGWGRGRVWGEGCVGGCNSLSITCKSKSMKSMGGEMGGWVWESYRIYIYIYIFINSCAKYVFSEHLRAWGLNILPVQILNLLM